MKKRMRIAAGMAIMLAALAAVAIFTMGSARGGESITTVKAEIGSGAAEISASGKIIAGTGAYSDVYPPTSGTLAKVYVKDGQRVHAGQRLATLDTGPLRLQVRQAKSAGAQARAALSAARLQAATSADIDAASENVAAMKVLYENAKRAYDLANTSDSADGRASADAARGVLRQAKAGLAGARAALAKARKSMDTRDQRLASEAGESEADAAYKVARKYLDAAVLTAPIDGVVIFNPMAPAGPSGKPPVAANGSAVTPALAPFSVVDLSRTAFSAEVDEADAGMLRLDAEASVTLDAFPGKEVKARVARIEPTAQRTATGGTVFVAELELQDPIDGILVGMKGDARIAPAERKQELTIPSESVFSENGSDFVYKVTGGRLTKTIVTVGLKTDSSAEVLSGLAVGDEVALPGSISLTDGMTVKTDR